MYNMPNSVEANRELSPIIRLGLQGPPGSGKTGASSTFPNPTFVNFDNALSVLNIPELREYRYHNLPFHDHNWCEALRERYNEMKGARREDVIPAPKPGQPQNKRDIFIRFLEVEAVLYTPEQTLIFDSWTSIQEAVDRQLDQETTYSKDGVEDTRAWWGRKKRISECIMSLISYLTCNVVVIFHEHIDRDDKGKPTGKIAPLQDGSFQDKVKKYFPNYFRQTRTVVDGKDKFQWSTKRDNMFDAKCVYPNMPALVPATYESFIKFK